MKHTVTHKMLIDKMKSILKGKLISPENCIVFRKSMSSSYNVVTLEFTLDNTDLNKAYRLLSNKMMCYTTKQISEKSIRKITVSEFGYSIIDLKIKDKVKPKNTGHRTIDNTKKKIK